jgi:hypothetical protein
VELSSEATIMVISQIPSFVASFHLWLIFFRSKSYALILTKMGLATFWVIFFTNSSGTLFAKLSQTVDRAFAYVYISSI